MATLRRWRVTPRFWTIALIIAIVYVAGNYAQGFIRIANLRAEIRRVEAQIEEVQARNVQFREELQRLNSDEFIERTAREELGLVMPGETALILIEQPAGRD